MDLTTVVVPYNVKKRKKMARKTYSFLKTKNRDFNNVIDSLALNYEFSNLVTITEDVTAAAANFGHPNVVTADATITLPATAAGIGLWLVCGADGVRVTVSPNASDKFLIDVAGAAGSDNKDIILASATSKKGDYVKLLGDGSNGWNILELAGTWVDES